MVFFRKINALVIRSSDQYANSGSLAHQPGRFLRPSSAREAGEAPAEAFLKLFIGILAGPRLPLVPTVEGQKESSDGN